MAHWRKRIALLMAAALVLSMTGVAPASAAEAQLANNVDPASPNLYRVGEVINYTLAVTNPASSQGEIVLHVWDKKPDGSILELDANVAIQPGETKTYSASYVVAEADVYLRGTDRIVMNTLYAKGVQPSTGDEIDVNAEKSSTIISPDVSIAKTVDFDGDGVFTDLETNQAGKTASWKIVVKNTGDDPLQDVVVTDTNGKSFNVGNLAVGASQELTYDTWPEANLTNVATVNAKDSRGVALKPKNDDAAVIVTPYSPDMAIDKSADATRVPIGTVVNYTFKVTNTGNVPLINLVATDDKLGVVGTADRLEPGASVTFKKACPPMMQDTHNIVTVEAWTEREQKLVRTDDWTVIVYQPFVEPDLAIEKVASKKVLNPGDTVKYTLTYKNVGEGPAVGYTITDDYDERYLTIIDSSGGVVSGGKIVWTFTDTIYKTDAPRTLTYTAKIKTVMPAGTTKIPNVVIIKNPDDKNPANDKDDESIQVNVDFLPYTGGEASTLLMAAAFAAGTGLVLRRKSRVRG